MAWGGTVLLNPSDAILVGVDGDSNPTSLTVSTGRIYEFRDCNLTVSQAGPFIAAIAVGGGGSPLLVRCVDAFISNGINDATSLFLSAPASSQVRLELRGRTSIDPFTSGESHVPVIACSGATEVDIWLWESAQISIGALASSTSSLNIVPGAGTLVDEAFASFFFIPSGVTYAGQLTTPVGNVPGVAGCFYYSIPSQLLFVGTGTGDLTEWATLAGPAV